ncbi:MAG TPA: EamA family transporter, partial [Bryobacteraceae bacterium]|nr:EamA family transporter [Bryobacteraceae bacterium]
VVGLMQKLATNRLSADAALVFYSLGYLVLFPVFWSRAEMTGIAPAAAGMGVLLGLTARSGEWFLFKALEHGGKASVVVPLTYTYPLITLLLAVALLGEHLSVVKWIGILLAVVAAILMSRGEDSNTKP